MAALLDDESRDEVLAHLQSAKEHLSAFHSERTADAHANKKLQEARKGVDYLRYLSRFR